MNDLIHLLTPISERLPDGNQTRYICFFDDGKSCRFVDYHIDMGFYSSNVDVLRITHWLDPSTITTKERTGTSGWVQVK